MQQLSAKPYLSIEERQMLLQKNDLRAFLELCQHWLTIAGALALVYFYTNVFTIGIALFILGGQQLACAILMHDAGHHSLFTNNKVNDFVGEWLGAFPIFQSMRAYRPYHLIHHFHTGLEEDPDLFLTRGYPTSRKSMYRKIFRDLTGITGIKTYFGLFAMYSGAMVYNLGGKAEWVPKEKRDLVKMLLAFIKNISGPVISNFIIFGILWLLGAAWLYLLWIGALLTTYQFSLRVRSMAEHAMMENQEDPIRNTRTTYANWLERLLFAPYHVNYHLEHHMLLGVPSYNLPKMHRLIKERGFYEKGVLEKNYWNVIKLAVKE